MALNFMCIYMDNYVPSHAAQCMLAVSVLTEMSDVCEIAGHLRFFPNSLTFLA